MGWPKDTHNLPRFEAVINACKQLEENDQLINNEAVRKILSGGSLRDISPIVRSYKTHQEILSHFQRLKPDFAHLLLSSAESAFKEMQSHLAEAITRTQATIENSANENAERANAQETEIDQLRNKISAIQDELSKRLDESNLHSEKISSLKREIYALNSLNTKQEKSLENQNGIIDTLKSNINALRKHYREESSRHNAAHESETSRLMRIIDNTVVKHDTENKALIDKVAKLEAENTQLRLDKDLIIKKQTQNTRKEAWTLRRNQHYATQRSKRRA